ncbi:unnamed protein product [Mycena citricolor]|uniref:Glycosyl transferase 48 domain-containing protein n=1 Tax=Mycena citricolor TaxID=2018698 RepID=A0AAD2Q1B7_9AGAR|nr:unnamed protein product [Mycena citricolor]
MLLVATQCHPDLGRAALFRMVLSVEGRVAELVEQDAGCDEGWWTHQPGSALSQVVLFLSELYRHALVAMGVASTETVNLDTQLAIDRFLKFYYGHPGFHINNTLVVLSVGLCRNFDVEHHDLSTHVLGTVYL